MRNTFVAFAALLLTAHCNDKKDAEYIIDHCIEVHGGRNYDHSLISFDFRGRHYQLKRMGGTYQYTRSFSDSLGNYFDVLSNDGFQRFLNDTLMDLSEEWTGRYTSSVNGVAYFALLPKPLHDPSVRKSMMGEEVISGKDYYKIQVTFNAEGGGEDHDDVFIYWIDKTSFTMDYFAYSYSTDDGGMRFREAIHVRTINGIRIADYKNYRPASEDVALENTGILFDEGKLQLLSEIRNEHVMVEIL